MSRLLLLGTMLCTVAGQCIISVDSFAQSNVSATAVSSQPARQLPPEPGTPRNFRVPPSRTFSLPNGMRVTLVPYGTVPKVAVALSVRTGVIDEGPQDVSLAAVMTDMLVEGTVTRTPQAISGAAADMGGAVSAFAGAELITASGEVLSEFAPRFIELLSDIIQHPRFAEADLKRTLDNHVRDNAMSLVQPTVLARKTFREMTYGNHPFARSFPDEKLVRAFSVARVRDFYAKNV